MVVASGVREKKLGQLLGGVAGVIPAGGVGGFAPISRVKSGIPMFFRPSSRSALRSSTIVGCGVPLGGKIGSVWIGGLWSATFGVAAAVERDCSDEGWSGLEPGVGRAGTVVGTGVGDATGIGAPSCAC